MKPVDMSPEAVTRRLRQVDELRELCLALAGPRLKRPWGVPDPVKAPSWPTDHTERDIPPSTRPRRSA